MDQDIPDNVRALIASHISSVVQLELLLLLHAQPARERTAADISRELRIDAGWVTGQLRELTAAGLLVINENAGPTFRYWAARPEIHDAVEGLAKAYAERRVTVIALIFSKPADPIRSFTDAFRLRREKE
jgi:predicted ArsR family transcriptional regulator